MNSLRPIRCIFYSHVWAIHMLNKTSLAHSPGEVLVELSVQSHLAPVLRQHAKMRWGMAALVTSDQSLDIIAQTPEHAPGPIVLAPNPSVSVSTLISAAGLLGTTKSRFESATLLVHVDDARTFTNAYHYVDAFGVLWDMSDPPTAQFAQLADVLVDNHFLTRDNWRGLHLVQHPLRTIPGAGDHSALWHKTLDEFPSLKLAA